MLHKPSHAHNTQKDYSLVKIFLAKYFLKNVYDSAYNTCQENIFLINGLFLS